MYEEMISNEIALLKKNSINIKVKNVEGFVVRLDSLSFCMHNYYERSVKLKTKCMRSGLNYSYFMHPQGNACCVFTECPVGYSYELLYGKSLKDCIIVQIYQSPEDFMASPLAYFYRNKKVGKEHTSNWDEFGYFTTTSNRYNRIPLVAATNRLRKNKVTKRDQPQIKQSTKGLNFLFGE